MARSQDPVVRHAHRNLGPAVAFLGLAIATAVALAIAVTAKHESGNTAQRLERRGPPCVDAKPRVRGVQPSRGCGRIFDLIANYCAEHRVFCLRSQRAAVQRATAESTQHVIGPTASLPPVGGGGDSKGNKPRSPTRPSPTPNGGGQGNGGGGQPNPPAGGGQANEPESKPTVTVPDVRDTVHQVAPELCKVQTPLGPVVQLCP